MRSRLLVAVAAVLAVAGVTAAEPAQAAISTYTKTYSVRCNNHPLKVWGTFQYDSSNNTRRGIRGGFDASDATQMYSRLGVNSSGSGSIADVRWSSPVIHGSAYNYGAWSSSGVYVLVVPWWYPGTSGHGCNGGFGYNIPAVG